MVQKEIDEKKKMEFKVDYDPKGDILYISFGDPRPAISVEVEDGTFNRFDVENNKLVGITVVDFSKRFSQYPGNPLTFTLPQHFQTDEGR